MSDYPRTRNGWVDSGEPLRASNRRTKCPNCSSMNFSETISLEKCNSCGYQVDYWGGGNAIADACEQRRWHAEEEARERRYREEEAEHQQWREDNS